MELVALVIESLDHRKTSATMQVFSRVLGMERALYILVLVLIECSLPDSDLPCLSQS